jgi:hypothetical protein
VIAGATDLEGNAAIYDDPAGSLGLLPYLGFCDAEDPIWSNTMDLLHSADYPLWLGNKPFPGLASRRTPDQASLAALCAELLGPHRERALALLRKLQLVGGIACRNYDPQTGHTSSGPWAAPLAALLARALLEDQKAGEALPAHRKVRRR